MNTPKFTGSPFAGGTLRSGKAASAVAVEPGADLERSQHTEGELTWLDRWRLQRVRSAARGQALIAQVQTEEQARSEVFQHVLENGKAIKMGQITQSAASQQSEIFRDCNRATAESEKRLQDERYERTKGHVYEYEQERRDLAASVEQGSLSQESAEFLEAQKRTQMVDCIDNDRASTCELVRHQRQLGRWAVRGFEVPPDEAAGH